MTKPILIAGLLGGLLGGVVSFAASRWIGKPEPPKAEPGAKIATPPDARAMADAYVAKLEALKYDDFMNEVKLGQPLADEKAFAELNTRFQKSRVVYHGVYGNHSEPFELIRETPLSKDLVRFMYLEKFQKGNVAWSFVLNQTKDGWRLNRVFWYDDLSFVFPGPQ